MKNPYEHWMGVRKLGSKPILAVNLLVDLEKTLCYWTSGSEFVLPNPAHIVE